MADARPRFRQAARRAAGRLAAACAAALLGWFALGWWYPGAVPEAYGRGRTMLEQAAGAVQAAAGGALAYVLDHPYFAVREVRVLGVERLEGADVVVMSGLDPHTVIWRIDPARIEERVRRHPWVKEVKVRRELPARLVFTVEEWIPAGIAAMDRLYYVDEDGVLFKALDEGDSVDFPFITGLRSAELRPREPGVRKKLSQALAFARTVERTTLGLSEVRFQPGGGIVLYPVSYPVPFHVGWGDWDRKLARLRWFVQEFRGQQARFKAVDVSFRGQVIARPRGRHGPMDMTAGRGTKSHG